MYEDFIKNVGNRTTLTPIDLYGHKINKDTTLGYCDSHS